MKKRILGITLSFVVAMSGIGVAPIVNESSQVQAKVSYVYITKTGKCYHKCKKCGSTKTSKKVKLSYAKKYYKKCRKCYK